MEILIRKAVVTDLEQVILLSDELTLSDLPYDKEIDINWAHTEDGKKYYTEKILGKNGICFVAILNNKIVGYATAIEKETPSYRLVKVAALENLVIDKNLRNMGIGKKLMDVFKIWAKEIKASKISVNVFALNKKGISFYKREGFLPFENTLEMHI